MSDDPAPHILVLRRGPGANCSSIGSAVEMLFLSASVGSALWVAVSALLRPDDAATASAEAPPEPSVPEREGPPEGAS